MQFKERGDSNGLIMKKITVIMVLVMLLTSLFAFGSSATVHSYTYDRNLKKDYVLKDDISSTMRYDVDSWYSRRESTDAIFMY